jgi:hypothetical protein
VSDSTTSELFAWFLLAYPLDGPFFAALAPFSAFFSSFYSVFSTDSNTYFFWFFFDFAVMFTVCGGFEAETILLAAVAPFWEDLPELWIDGTFSATTVFDLALDFCFESDNLFSTLSESINFFDFYSDECWRPPLPLDIVLLIEPSNISIFVRLCS